MPINELEQGIKRLKMDLKNDTWLKKYDHLLNLKSYDAGYRIIITL